MSRMTTRMISGIFLVFLIAKPALAAEIDSTSRAIAFQPMIRSAQLDGAIFLYGAAYGGSLDFDFFQVHSTQPSSIGARVGLQHVDVGGPGGRIGGSPYLDYCTLARLTFLGDHWRFDALFGYAYQRSNLPAASPSGGILKSGAELKWKIVPGFFGLIVKGNAGKGESFIGIGVYGGWED